jgi:hypothetical protein
MNIENNKSRIKKKSKIISSFNKNTPIYLRDKR